MSILKFKDEQDYSSWYYNYALYSNYEMLFLEEWLLNNCAAMWHTGEIWIIV